MGQKGRLISALVSSSQMLVDRGLSYDKILLMNFKPNKDLDRMGASPLESVERSCESHKNNDTRFASLMFHVLLIVVLIFTYAITKYSSCPGAGDE